MLTPKTIDFKDGECFGDLDDALWSFTTKHYAVALFAEEEDLDPADSFSDKRDVRYAKAAYRYGNWEKPSRWFMAVVAVYLDGRRIGMDILGGCSYKSFHEFYAGHRDKDPLNRNCTIMRRAKTGDPAGKISIGHYFPDMVREAITNARVTLAKHRDGLVGAA